MKFKNILKKAFCFSLVFSMLLSSVNVYAGDFSILYTNKEIQQIANGVTHEKTQRLYSTGWYDINVITVDTTQSDATFSVLETVNEYGLKAPVTSLAKANGAIVAVNADFFSAGTAQTSMGNIVENGSVTASNNYYNFNTNVYAGFYLDKYNTPFIDYLKTSLGFYNASGNLELQGKNKITNFSKPVYFDRTAIKSTSDLDKRFKNLYKIVVQNNKIINISAAGATVEVPENGYIIVMSSNTALEKLKNYSVGQEVKFVEENSFKFRPQKSVSEVNMGLSGGGEILRNGQYISNGFIIGESARHPRTCIGVNKEKNKVYIVTIDGRGKSIGATHYEASQILLSYGIYDAIHYDGGGSTTMAVRNEGETDVSLVNTPSEGSQRYVANALGIKVPQTDNVPAQIKVSPETNYKNIILAEVPVKFNVECFDKYHNPVTGDVTNQVVFENTGVDGVWEGNVFTPSQEGLLTVNAKLGEYTYTTSCNVLSAPNNGVASAKTPNLVTGESTYLTFSTVNIDGYKSTPDYSKIEWTVDNPSLGYVQGGKFFATADGTATVTGSYNGMSDSVTITIGKAVSYINSFETPMNMIMSYYPPDKGITGGGAITGAYAASGSKSMLLNYSFIGETTQTQAAYICIDQNPINLPGKPTDICMWVKGDKSGNLFKIEIGDANGNRYNLSVIDSMDSDEWQYTQTPVPENVAYPIKINKFYVASLESAYPQSGTIFIDNLSQLAPPAQPNIIENFVDYKNVDLSSMPEDGEEDVTIFGQTATMPDANLSNTIFQTALAKMQYGAKKIVLTGNSSQIQASYVPSFVWENKYNTTETDNFSIINLATNNGCIRTANLNQWRWFQSYLKDFSRQNIIINMDRDIWDNNYRLTDSRENEMLDNILSNLVAETGKNVIVVSACGYEDKVTVKNGVRYVTLSGLTSNNPTDLTSYRYLRIRGTKDDMSYSLMNVY